MKNVSLLAITFFIFSLVSRVVYGATAKAVIQGTDESSALVGSAQLQDTDEGLRVEMSIFGAPPGIHGIHIHENGSCEDKGNAAGGHYNPMGVKHGFLVTEGLENAHAGDFGNIEINDAGEGSLLLVLPGLTVAGGEHNVEGRAIILHEKQDDFGQPTGNAGGRIACGIIQVESETNQ
ncbi:MAG: superoxide dismutase family protein [Candidatus Omnitrophica bacterium]|nr:superoxide dismutase family protein [Candidatus Omnitrophota bacterium]